MNRVWTIKTNSHRPSPALIVAMLALLVALGGTSYAAITITGRQIKDNTITSADVKNRSLRAIDLKPGQLSAGTPGAKGETGATGPKGRHRRYRSCGNGR